MKKHYVNDCLIKSRCVKGHRVGLGFIVWSMSGQQATVLSVLSNNMSHVHSCSSPMLGGNVMPYVVSYVASYWSNLV